MKPNSPVNFFQTAQWMKKINERTQKRQVKGNQRSATQQKKPTLQERAECKIRPNMLDLSFKEGRYTSIEQTNENKGMQRTRVGEFSFGKRVTEDFIQISRLEKEITDPFEQIKQSNTSSKPTDRSLRGMVSRLNALDGERDSPYDDTQQVEKISVNLAKLANQTFMRRQTAGCINMATSIVEDERSLKEKWDAYKTAEVRELLDKKVVEPLLLTTSFIDYSLDKSVGKSFDRRKVYLDETKEKDELSDPKFYYKKALQELSKAPEADSLHLCSKCKRAVTPIREAKQEPERAPDELRGLLNKLSTEHRRVRSLSGNRGFSETVERPEQNKRKNSTANYMSLWERNKQLKQRNSSKETKDISGRSLGWQIFGRNTESHSKKPHELFAKFTPEKINSFEKSRQLRNGVLLEFRNKDLTIIDLKRNEPSVDAVLQIFQTIKKSGKARHK
jgi:hypothetical protein